MEILELKLKTNNLIATDKFYGQTIGLKKADETEKSICFDTGTSKLIFELVENEQCPKYHFAFNIPANKIEEAIVWTSQRTKLIPVAENSFVTEFKDWKARSIYFFDNNRNILEFICRSDLNNSTDIDFSANTILSISEIGLVTDKPLELGKEIIEIASTNFFAKGPKREDFVAVGTDNGLFVITHPDRNWYPTQEKAEQHLIRAKFRVAENIFDFEIDGTVKQVSVALDNDI